MLLLLINCNIIDISQ